MSLCWASWRPIGTIHPIDSLIFTINMWPNVLSNIWLFLNLVKLGIKNFQKFKWFQNCVYFSLQLQGLLSYWHFYDSSLHKSTKTYPRSMLLWGAETGRWAIPMKVICLVSRFEYLYTFHTIGCFYSRSYDWQKVMFNTDLFKDTEIYTEMMALTKIENR